MAVILSVESPETWQKGEMGTAETQFNMSELSRVIISSTCMHGLTVVGEFTLWGASVQASPSAL